MLQSSTSLTNLVCNLQRFHHQPTTTMMAQIYVSMNKKIAETIRPNLPVQPEFRGSRFRPISPVKVLSNFLGGIRDQNSHNKLPIVERSISKQSSYSVKDMKPGLNLGLSNTFEPPKTIPIVQTTDNVLESAFVQLENTLNTYIVALRSRCGNVVGKVIHNRANADELMVNELYNILRRYHRDEPFEINTNQIQLKIQHNIRPQQRYLSTYSSLVLKHF